MKRYTFFVIATLFISISSHAQKYDFVDIDTVLSVGEVSWCHSLYSTDGIVVWVDFDQAIFRSVDAGLSWEAVQVPGYPNCVGTSLRPLNKDTAFYCEVYTGFYRTMDGGKTWDTLDNVNLNPNWFHFFDFQDGIQFDAIPNEKCNINKNYKEFKIWKTTDAGDNWIEIKEPDRPAFLTGYYKHFANNMNRQTSGDTICFGTGSGRVFMSHDRGDTWSSFFTGLGEGPVLNSVAMHSTKNIAVLAPYTSTMERKPRFSFTNDGGETWTNNNDIGTNADGIAAVPGLDSSFLLLRGMSGVELSETGLYITHDGGKTFSVLLNDVPCHCITFVNDSVAILSSTYAYKTGGPHQDYLFRLTFRNAPVNISVPQYHPPGFSVFPNLVRNMLNINVNTNNPYKIRITSVNGQLLLEKWMEGSSNQLDLSYFNQGIYFITIRSKDFTTTEKIMKLE